VLYDPPVATVVGLTIVKRFTYRADATEEFSNTYWLTGSVPSDAAAWKTLADALIAQEKTVYQSTVSVVRAYGYNSDADNAPAVWSYDYLAASATVPGTLSPTGTWTTAPGDAAVWLRWKTSRTNSNGKSIYLRKYFHGAVINTAASPDTINATQKTNLNALGAKLQDGSFAEARTVRSRLHAETLVGHDASSYITTRTLKRRGKRPSP
jgi:hypothetical protein